MQSEASQNQQIIILKALKMKMYIIGPIIEDMIANRLKIDFVAKKYDIKIEKVQLLMDYYYGIGDYKLKSMNLDLNQSLLEIKKYNSNNLMIIDKNSIILEY